ncbi:MAG: hypothetical protein PHE88_10965 [Elusimicrobia bacterium]|nr:hypothetical protein [Elusimicrobiota bacterium]
MIKKMVSLILVVSLSLVFVPVLFSKDGGHVGEQNMLNVNILFSNNPGTTVTNASGTTYKYYGYAFTENKVYPSQYWGEFPLFFFGEQVGVTVKITNNGPRAKAKVRIKTESYVLRTDGSNGAPMMEPKIVDLEVARGETKTIDASFIAQNTAAMESGLDRILVKVLHINEGDGSGNPEPALIMVKEGVFCPPEYVKK